MKTHPDWRRRKELVIDEQRMLSVLESLSKGKPTVGLIDLSKIPAGAFFDGVYHDYPTRSFRFVITDESFPMNAEGAHNETIDIAAKS